MINTKNQYKGKYPRLFFVAHMNVDPGKLTNDKLENSNRFEDVSPIKNYVIFHCHVGLGGEVYSKIVLQ